jgi:hypothetical protein
VLAADRPPFHLRGLDGVRHRAQVSRRTTLITIDTAAITQLLTPCATGTIKMLATGGASQGSAADGRA